MKYFNNEFICMVNHIEPTEQGTAAWEKICDAYQAYIASVQDGMPRSLVDVFGEEPYHDWLVREITLKPGRNKKKLELTLGNGAERARLIMEDVSSMNLNLSNLSDCMMGRLSWLYSEIECMGEGQYQASILFDSCDELTVVFREFRILSK